MRFKFTISLLLFFVLLVLILNFWLLPAKTSLTEKAFLSEKASFPSLFGRLLKKKETPIVIIATGDVMLGRSVNAKMRSLIDFAHPFLETASLLESADLTFINLESPFYDHCPTTNEGMIFCADPKAIKGLIDSGVDVANLANNHILNYGSKGLSFTQNLLRQNNIDYLNPSGNLVIKKVKSTRFGFLGFDLTSGYQEEEIIGRVKEAKLKVDVLIVSFHWGIEYAEKPSLKQTNLAHQVVDAGGNLILGHHSHVIQPVENYREAKIVYSFGNFIFDQNWSEETRKGLVGIFTFQSKKLVKTEFREVYINDSYQPSFADNL